ncbi:MAG: AI-2E family transporter [Bacteroidales bacterium]|nr:AI-2E family transporter [Bacteroidales bacterium]
MLNKPPRIITLAALLLFIILLFYGLIVAKNFLSTIVLGVIFSYLIYPLVNFLEVKARFPRILANLLSIILLLGLLTLIVFIMYRNVGKLTADMPALVEKAHYNIDQLGIFIENTFGYTVDRQNLLIHDSINNILNLSGNFTKSLFKGTTNTIFTLGLMPVFMFYMLYYREKFKKFILMVVPTEKEEDARAIIRKITFITPRYIGGVFTVVLILTILNSFGLWIVGVKYAILFGIISALFNLIPYFGTWIGASIPFMFALLTGDTPRLAFGVILLFVVIQFLENNILTPNITGSYVNLNPLFTILLIIIGGIVWGIIGMFVVVPMAAMMKIVFDHSKSMKPYAYLIGADDENRRKAVWRQKLIIKSKRTLKRR